MGKDLQKTGQEIQGTASKTRMHWTRSRCTAFVLSPRTYVYEQQRLLTHLPSIARLLSMCSPFNWVLSQAAAEHQQDPSVA
jgi:hypothetical protein